MSLSYPLSMIPYHSPYSISMLSLFSLIILDHVLCYGAPASYHSFITSTHSYFSSHHHQYVRGHTHHGFVLSIIFSHKHIHSFVLSASDFIVITLLSLFLNAVTVSRASSSASHTRLIDITRPHSHPHTTLSLPFRHSVQRIIFIPV